MSLFRPTLVCEKVTDITPQMLQKLEIKAVLLDVDNTLTSYISKKPIDGSIEWAKNLQKMGYLVYIVSNNYPKRVGEIAEKFDLPYVSFALKPSPFGFRKARKQIGIKGSDCLVVGDQIFTDILGANLGFMKSVLLTPIEIENGFTIKIRRHFEKSIRNKLHLQNKDNMK